MDSTQENQSDEGYRQVPTEPPTEKPYPIQSSVTYGQPMQYQQQMLPPQYGPPGGAYYSPMVGGQPIMLGQQQYLAGQQQPIVVYATSPPQNRFIGEIVLSCFVCWCCCCCLGLAAFYLAIKAQNKPAAEAESARRLARQSMMVSIAGIVIGVILIVIIFVIEPGQKQRHTYP